MPELEKRRGGVTGRGSLKDKIWIAPDFDEADAEIQRMFEESEIFPDESAPPALAKVEAPRRPGAGRTDADRHRGRFD